MFNQGIIVEEISWNWISKPKNFQAMGRKNNYA
jgi:hypothetical protein